MSVHVEGEELLDENEVQDTLQKMKYECHTKLPQIVHQN